MDEYRQNTIIIEEELNEGQRIAIFPIGKKGLELKLILEQRYGHTGIYIDNYMSKYNRNIIDFNKYIILQTMINSIRKHFRITDEQMQEFINDFYLGLPEYMQAALANAFWGGRFACKCQAKFSLVR